MHNLIKSRAVFEILKKPLPELLRFYRDSDSDSECEGSSTDVASCSSEATTATISAAEAAAETAEAEAAAKLNINASVFVPRLKDAEDLRLVDLKRQFEALDVRKPLAQPKLLLPWKGFPKPQHIERANKPLQCKELKAAVTSDESKEESPRPLRAMSDKESTCSSSSSLSSSRKKHLKERSLMKSVPDDKRREQERKVALEALKLVEQRRMREPNEEPQIIVHLTRLPVDFTAEERVRVNRLRIIKREHIESVLREMRDERELKQQKAEGIQPTSRYICLQRGTQPEAQPEQQPQQQASPQPLGSSQPKRYIPTVKQWDERCKAKANEAAAGANKENNMSGKTANKSEEYANTQRAMGPSSQGNIMASKSPQQSGGKDRELFVPRYWPPAPLVVKGEIRRGNLTHARNITRAFANCGLLPTPSTAWELENGKDDYELMPHAPSRSMKRYAMDQLLKLEPQPHKLEKPNIAEALLKLGFMCE
ncbi:uncharacterized protein LOC111603526 isoform X2 [Drosophila hydei]|uniref:Uncharacterized protein LOC111603526 isoform X2 n=1 Tax=Drosophila hydei TaxID=7224 RepID=A0A6J1MIN6_DROHY|nr:uncharacterized protein LOC111603526 isoform X2 [Drosophila hydei]